MKWHGKYDYSDREIIQQLLQSGFTCPEVADKWDSDVTQLYRKLRQWKLDTKGNDIKKPKPIDEKRKRVIEFVDIRQGWTTVQEIALATGFSWEFVKDVVIDRSIKLLGKPKGYESERKRQCLLVNWLRDEGMPAMQAQKKAGIKSKTYNEWCRKLGLQYKNKPST